MDTSPDAQNDKTVLINQSLAELNHFLEELEQQVRDNLYCFKPLLEGDDAAIAVDQQRSP